MLEPEYSSRYQRPLTWESFAGLFGGGSAGAGGSAAAGTTAGGAAAGGTAAGATTTGATTGAATTGAATYGGLTLGEWAQLGASAINTASQISQASASAAQDESLAKSAIRRARSDEFANRRNSAKVIAKQQAGAAAAGLDIGSGTPLELLMDSAYNAELNALNIRKAGQFESDYYKTRARRSKASIPGLAFGGLLSGLGTYLK